MFHIEKENTTVRTELVAGTTSFMTVAYIIAVNGAILQLAACLMKQLRLLQ